MKKNKMQKILMVATLTSASTFAFGASIFNDRVSVQGYLKASGAALNEAAGYPMKFVIKRNSTPVWCQVPAAAVPVVSGIFSQVLSGASNCLSLSNVLNPSVFTHQAASDTFSIDVTVDVLKDGFGGPDDATFAGIDLVSSPMAIYADQAQSAQTLSGVLAVASGGTGATSVEVARANLGLGPLAVLTLSGNSNDVLKGDGTFGPMSSANNLLSGDVNGNFSATSVDKIKGRSVSSAAPSAGQVLGWNAASSTWEPQTPAASGVSSVAGKTGIVVLQSSDIQDASSSSSPDSLVLRDSSGNFSAGTITANLSGLATNVAGTVAVANGGTGVTAFVPNQIVVSNVSGGALESFGCMTGQVLGFGALGILQCENTGGAGEMLRLDVNSNLNLSGSIEMSANKNILLSNNSSDPTGMTGADRGRMWFNTSSNQIKYFDGNSVQTLKATGAGMTSLNGSSVGAQIFATPGTSGTSPSWSTVAAAGVHTLNIPLASAAGVVAGLLSKVDYDSFAAKLGASSIHGGDVSGVFNNLSVDKIKGRMVSSAAPTQGQVLAWNSGNSSWEPQTVSSSSGGAVSSVAGRTGAVVLNSEDISDASSASSSNTLVKRDASGNFSAGTITATLNGDASNVTGVVQVANGGTGASTANAARANLGAAASGANTDITSINGSARQASVVMAPTTGGTASAYTLSFSPSLAALSSGQTFFFRIGATNAAGVTLNVDGLGAKTLAAASTGAALNAGDLVAGQVVQTSYDGVKFVVNLAPQFVTVSNLNCGTNINATFSATCPAIAAPTVNSGDVVQCSPSQDPSIGQVSWSALAGSGSITLRLHCNSGAKCSLTTRNWKCVVQK